MSNPTIYNPALYQGDTWGMQVSLTQTLNSSATDFDLTGYTATSQLRRYPQSAHTVLDFTCSIPTSSGCLISLTAPASLTEQVAAGSYAWDVQISGTSGTVSGTVYTVVRGYAAVVSDVTR